MNDKRKSLEYKEWRDRVKNRDGNACRKCGFEKNLEVHHIKPLKKYPDFALVLDNGITLCGNCHSLLKGREETEDLRVFLDNDPKIERQLQSIEGSFFKYLKRKLKSESQIDRGQAVSGLLSHLTAYPSSLREMLSLLVYVVNSENWPDEGYPKPQAIEWLRKEAEKARQPGHIRPTWQTPTTTQMAVKAIRKYEWRVEQKRIQEQQIQQQRAKEKEEKMRQEIQQAKERRREDIGCSLLGWGAVIAMIVIGSRC